MNAQVIPASHLFTPSSREYSNELLESMEDYAISQGIEMFSPVGMISYETVNKNYPKALQPWIVYKGKIGKRLDEKVLGGTFAIIDETDKRYITGIGNILMEVDEFLRNKPSGEDLLKEKNRFNRELENIIGFVKKDQELLPELKGHYLISPQKLHMTLTTYAQIMCNYVSSAIGVYNNNKIQRGNGNGKLKPMTKKAPEDKNKERGDMLSLLDGLEEELEKGSRARK